MNKALAFPTITCSFLVDQETAFVGPPLEKGPLPTLFYFALTAEESLTLDPFNQMVATLSSLPCRIFSLTLPGHIAGQNPADSLAFWTKSILAHDNFLAPFLQKAKALLDDLEKQGLLVPEKVGAAGLSRGAFAATHLAAYDPRVAFILGFAPLTDLQASSSCHELADSELAATLALHHLNDKLFNKKLRFYIGNHDTLVKTKRCFEFTHHLAKTAYHHKIRSPQVDLIITPSIGHRGHGTPPEIFIQGAQWAQQQLFD